jgi:hypothetical protein
MADAPEVTTARRERIKAALAVTKGPKEKILLEELAAIWGVGKPAFVNLRKTILDFPKHDLDGKTFLYPRRRAIEALDRHERRDDEKNDAKGRRLAALVGVEDAAVHFSITDLMKANSLRADLQAEREKQGLLVPRPKVQSTASKVFTILQRALNDLGTLVDPNGQHSPEIREAADKAGQDLLLRIHAEMKDMLTSDDDRTPGPAPTGSRSAKPRADGTRRGGKSSLA